MAQSTLEEVRRLAEQLTPDEKQALLDYIQAQMESRDQSIDDWQALFESLVIDIGPWPEDWSLRREDWYGDVW